MSGANDMQKTVSTLGFAVLVLIAIIWVSNVVIESHIRKENQIREFRTSTGNLCVVSAHVISCDWR